MVLRCGDNAGVVYVMELPLKAYDLALLSVPVNVMVFVPLTGSGIGLKDTAERNPYMAPASFEPRTILSMTASTFRWRVYAVMLLVQMAFVTIKTPNAEAISIMIIMLEIKSSDSIKPVFFIIPWILIKLRFITGDERAAILAHGLGLAEEYLFPAQ